MREDRIITGEELDQPFFPLTSLDRYERKLGRKEGRLDGMRTIVMEMATLRLQLLVEQIRQRADQAGEAELHALCAKLTDCKMETLKELLSGER